MEKLLIFGDSILRGVMYDDEKAKYLLCNDNKFESFKNYNVEVLNNSRMGFTIDKGLGAIQKRIDIIEPGSTVLLEFGGNDCDFNWKEISENPKGTFSPNTIKNEFIKKYESAVEMLKKCGARVLISSLIPIDAEKYMSWISRGLNYSAIISWLGDVSMLSRWQEYYNSIIEKISITMNCELVDIREMFLTSHNFKELLCADGIHPTQEGHDLIKKTISSELITA